MPPDSSAIDSSLLALLNNDATLRSYLPDGVYFDEGPANLTRFGIVSIVLADDLAAFGRGREATRAIESILYAVKAVMRVAPGTSIEANMKAAAARIDVLLEGAEIIAVGYGCMSSAREERIRYTEVDDVDASIRWLHRGGQYRVEMAIA